MENWSPKAQPESSISFDTFARSLSTEFDALLQNAWTRCCTTALSSTDNVIRPPQPSGPKWTSGGAKFVDHLYDLRRLRDKFFAKHLFADPCWDILLDLYRARLNHKAISVSSACIAAAVPPTTALRHIKTLEDGGLVIRTPDKFDHRRIYVAMTDKGAEAMEQWIEMATTGIQATSPEPNIFL